MVNNRAESLFKNNTNKEVLVEHINGLRFQGILIFISCNTLIIQTKDGSNEMVRYEDIRYLLCRKMKEDEYLERC